MRWALLLAVAALATTGCYAHQRIPVADLQKLTAIPGRAPEADLKGKKPAQPGQPYACQ